LAQEVLDQPVAQIKVFLDQILSYQLLPQLVEAVVVLDQMLMG
jgi:hypothetical protein